MSSKEPEIKLFSNVDEVNKIEFDKLDAVIKKEIKKAENLNKSSKDPNWMPTRSLNINGETVSSKRDLSIDTIKTSVYFTRETHALLKRLSEQNHVSVSAILNLLVLGILSKNED